MPDISEFIEVTNKSKSSDEVFRCFEKVLGKYGYDRICYTLFTDHPSINQQAGHGVLRNYPSDWMEYYTQSGYENLDPVRLLAVKANRPFRWKNLNQLMILRPQNQKVMNEANEAKLLDGIAIPLHGPGGEIAGVGIASSDGEPLLSEDQICEINLICHQFHQAFCLVHEHSTEPEKLITLSPREREILYWISKNKSQPDIADILKISEHTVDTHKRRIYQKLNVTNHVSAVVKAIMQGIIQP